MSQYANGYYPTQNLRQVVMTDGVLLLQQEWVSGYVGFPPQWRFVARYQPTDDELVEWTT